MTRLRVWLLTFSGAKGLLRSRRLSRISPSSLRTSKAPFLGCTACGGSKKSRRVSCRSFKSVKHESFHAVPSPG